MRDTVIKVITEAARQDSDIMFLSADMGAPALDEFRRDLPDQFIQVGIAEQNMIDLAAGLALSGKKVFCYAMAPFLPARCFEQIKCSLASMNLPVCLIGVGVGLGYDHTSMTHIQVEDIALMRTINHVEILTPADNAMAEFMTQYILEENRFFYLRLERIQGVPPVIYVTERDLEWASATGVSPVLFIADGRYDLSIVASGGTLSPCISAAENLHKVDIDAQVLDLLCLKPFPTSEFLELTKDTRYILTVEEHVLAGGMGAAIIEAESDRRKSNEIPHHIRRLGLHDHYKCVNGDRDVLRQHFGLDANAIYTAALKMVEN